MAVNVSDGREISFELTLGVGDGSNGPVNWI